MPPIPTTLNDDVRAQIDALERRRKDLQDFQIPRLRTFTGPLTKQQQHAAELREDIEAFARGIESLDIAVDDQKGERNRRELRRIVDEFKAGLASLRKDSRAALLHSKRAIDAKNVSNREELMRSNVVREKQDLNEKVAEDSLMTASNNVTEALQRTLTLMQGELEKSVLSTQLLDASSASLRSASSTHDVLDGLMSTSKHLITALEKSDWLDRLLIIAALLFFVIVVLFILKQRLVDRGLRIAFWWTRFIPSIGSFGDDEAIINALEKGDAAALTDIAATVVSTVLATASTLATSLSATPSSDIPISTPSTASLLETVLPSSAGQETLSTEDGQPSLPTETVEQDPTPDAGEAFLDYPTDIPPATPSPHDEL